MAVAFYLECPAVLDNELVYPVPSQELALHLKSGRHGCDLLEGSNASLRRRIAFGVDYKTSEVYERIAFAYPLYDFAPANGRRTPHNLGLLDGEQRRERHYVLVVIDKVDCAIHQPLLVPAREEPDGHNDRRPKARLDVALERLFYLLYRVPNSIVSLLPGSRAVQVDGA